MPATPMGIMGIMGLPSVRHVLKEDVLTDGESTLLPSDSDDDPLSEDGMSDHDIDGQPPPWDHWEEFATSHIVDESIQQCAAADVMKAQLLEAEAEGDVDMYVPAMPCSKVRRKRHRIKNTVNSDQRQLYNAMVARPVNRKELEGSDRAKAARGEASTTVVHGLMVTLPRKDGHMPPTSAFWPDSRRQ